MRSSASLAGARKLFYTLEGGGRGCWASVFREDGGSVLRAKAPAGHGRLIPHYRALLSKL